MTVRGLPTPENRPAREATRCSMTGDVRSYSRSVAGRPGTGRNAGARAYAGAPRASATTPVVKEETSYETTRRTGRSSSPEATRARAGAPSRARSETRRHGLVHRAQRPRPARHGPAPRDHRGDRRARGRGGRARRRRAGRSTPSRSRSRRSAPGSGRSKEARRPGQRRGAAMSSPSSASRSGSSPCPAGRLLLERAVTSHIITSRRGTAPARAIAASSSRSPTATTSVTAATSSTIWRRCRSSAWPSPWPGSCAARPP